MVNRSRTVLTLRNLILLLLFAFAFGAGMLLRGPVTGGMDWCRDMDYGSLPQWVGIAVGIVFGAFTAFGVVTAARSYQTSRQAYELDVRTREISQARLIYAELVMNAPLKPKQQLQIPLSDVDTDAAVFPGVRGRDVMSPPSGTPNIDAPLPATVHMFPGGSKIAVVEAVADARVYFLRVINDSEELISGVTMSIRDGFNMSQGKVASVMIKPNECAERVIVMAESDAVGATTVNVTFRDATGQWWTREGADPVTKSDPPEFLTESESAPD